MVRYFLEQPVFLYDTDVKYDLLESVSKNFYINFMMKEFAADNSQFGE
jgi:hypothetical protein